MVSRVENIMVRNVLLVREADTVIEVARKMAERNVGSAVVVDEESKPLGIVTERDLLRKVVSKGLDPSRISVRDIMSWPVITVKPTDSILNALRIMNKFKVRHLPVVDDGRVVGMLSIRDVIAGVMGILLRGGEEDYLEVISFLCNTARK